MRIVAGNYRGKNLITPQDQSVRPTSDRAREAVFNILYSFLGGFNNAKVLDVFAGTGAFGLEALSRGAKKICLIDKDITLALKNSALFDKEKDKIILLRADVSNLPKAKDQYNLVFSDAPYDKGLNEIAVQNLIQQNWLEDKAVVIIETRYNEKLLLPDCFEAFDERLYGMAKIHFYIFHAKD